jgi:glutathione synthase/RimK-type ligase-like ATP-grasp enzyme
MILAYSGRSAIGAKSIASASGGAIIAKRTNRGDINWGVANAQTILNSDTSNATNKRAMRNLFAEHDVPMPKLYTLHEAHALAKEGHMLVGRPDTHMKGRGFWKINSNNSFMKALRGTRKKKAATHFMEYVVAPREYRVHIFQGKSLRISEKAHTAFHEYTTIKPTHNVKHVRKAAKQAVNALGLDFGTVDILADDNNCWVLEVNTAAGLGGSMPRVWAEAFLNWEGERM